LARGKQWEKRGIKDEFIHPQEAEMASRSVSWLLEFERFQKSVAYRVDEVSGIGIHSYKISKF
jgi:hypothetical protein